MPDYESLSMREKIKYDRRSFWAFFIDHLIDNQRILNLIFKRSLFHPFFIRINEFIFELSLTFATNALLFSDSYIDARANDPRRVNIFIKIERFLVFAVHRIA
jgi:hypothetical protein